MKSKEQRLKALVNRIGEDKYAALRECTNNNKIIIDNWLEGKVTYPLKSENLPPVDAIKEKKVQAELEGLLLYLLLNAIYRHDALKTNKDKSLALLIDINDKNQFVRENDIELVSEAINTKNHWCIFQVLHFLVSLKTPLVRVKDPDSTAHRTNIFAAYHYNQPNLVRAKLDAGGDLNETNDMGETLLQIAKREKKQAWIDLLVSYYPPMFHAYELNDINIIETLVFYKFGEHLDQKGPEGLTLYELAQRDNRQDIIKLIEMSMEEHSDALHEIEDIKLQEVKEYTENICLEVIDESFLSDLAEHSCYLDLVIEYWYSGKDKRSVEEFLNGLLEYTKFTHDYENYASLYISLLKQPKDKSKEELEKYSESRQQEIQELGDELVELFDRFSDPDGFYNDLTETNVNFYIFTNTWLKGVNYREYSATLMFNVLLQKIIFANDATAFKIMIDAHKKRNFINIDNKSMLTSVIRTKNIEFVRELLDLGCDPNGDIDDLPLYSACVTGDLEIVKLLVEKGANPHLLNANGKSFSLFATAMEYKKEIVEYIEQYIKEHPPISKQSKKGHQPKKEEDANKDDREARLKEMAALGVTEKDLTRLAQVNRNIIGQRFTDWLKGKGEIANVSARELFISQLDTIVDVPPRSEGEILIFKFIMGKQLYPMDELTQSSLVNRAVFYNLEDFVEPMLEAGFSANGNSGSGSTLQNAYNNSSRRLIKLLLKHHAVVSPELLELARSDNNPSMLKLLDPDYLKENKENKSSKHESKKTGKADVNKVSEDNLDSVHESTKSSEADEDNSKEDSSDQESSSGEEPTALEQCIRGIFSNVAKGTDTYEHISDQWTARGKSTVSDEDMKAMPNFIEEKLNGDNFEVHLKTEDLDIHVRRELQNMLAYTSKLYREYQNDAKGNKKKVLGEKVDAATEFIRKVLSQEELTEASIRKAYNSFEQRDKNRSTGLYRLYARWHDQWYEEKKGKKKTERLVKSTLGTFGNLLYKAVENQVVEVKEEEEQLERSGAPVSSGG